MANKVIAIKSNKPSSITTNVSEVYLDVDAVAGLNYFMKPEPQNEDEYLAMLITEHGSAEDAYQYVVTEMADASDRKFIQLQFENVKDYKEALRQWLLHGKFKVEKLVNVNAIKNSIHQIFTWIPGERIINPEFGSNVRRLLYEGITEFNIEQIISEIRRSVSVWEPRVQIQKIVNVGTVDDTEDNTVHLEVLYTIPGLTDDQLYAEPIYATNAR